MAGFNFGTPSSTASTFSLGSNITTGSTSGFNFGASTTSTSSAAPIPLGFKTTTSAPGAVTFGTQSLTSNSGFTFGSTGGLSMGTPATNQATAFTTPTGNQPSLMFGSTPANTTPALSFGSTPGQNTQMGLNFGGTPTATPSFGNTVATAQPLSFGSTPATTQTFSFGSTPAKTQTLTFGSTPATTQTLSFGSTPATTQTLSFGSTPATSQSLTFGSTLATTQPLTFGSTPATSQPLSFGSTPATTQPLNFASTPATPLPLTIGSTPATTQPLTFGSTPATTQPITFASTTQPTLSFGSTPATTQPTLNFGLSTPATTTSTGFALGMPATTTTANKGLSFGLGGQSAVTKPGLSFGTTTTTSTPSLLNISTPKTTATTGFSLSVSGAGSGSLFALPTTSAPATSAPSAPFKGLGGVDPTSNQGSGPKDTKSAKENVVNPEIMQTLDTFKNFVKQQKNLGCEVSRAPVKPMHKVTEDCDSLSKFLRSVSNALQKNRVITNKLKSDTTKCLSLCEMAQRSHDTPPGLQNDNIAPLEFFIQLVSKFERDIQVLRQEIDNTEKHVNSLSYPAILTPQELSIALRRLHDSFVALAGRLQTAHTGVIAQKERHLSLRRHFLKDPTNIFDTATRLARKPQGTVFLPKLGPTPFSSMGGANMTLMSGQEKPVTFSTGPNSTLTGWGSSAMSNTATSTLLQSPGQSQTLDSQNFQLGKPPVGNKRGKR